MIVLEIANARVVEFHTVFHVLHPQNDTILATCDNKQEAEAVVDFFNTVTRVWAVTTSPPPADK